MTAIIHALAYVALGAGVALLAAGLFVWTLAICCDEEREVLEDMSLVTWPWGQQ